MMPAEHDVILPATEPSFMWSQTPNTSNTHQRARRVDIRIRNPNWRHESEVLCPLLAASRVRLLVVVTEIHRLKHTLLLN